MVDEAQKKLLVRSWNDIFGSDISSDIIEETSDAKKLFDLFLLKLSADKKLTYSENIGLCVKNARGITLVSYEEGKMSKKNVGMGAEKKIKAFLNRFDYIMFNFEIDTRLMKECLEITPNKKFLRFDLIRNIFSGGQTNYLSTYLTFSGIDDSVFLSEELLSILKTDKKMMCFLTFASFLLSHFGKSIVMGATAVKSKISLSDYGRWYWKGKGNIQNDTKVKNLIKEKILDNGDKFISIDFISASPSMLYLITGSESLGDLVRSRILNIEDEKYAANMKKLINVFVHSAANPEKVKLQLKSSVDFDYLQSRSEFNLDEKIESVFMELMLYNNQVIEQYESDLSSKERMRRMVIPEIPIMDDLEKIKTHRIYLQGHVNDVVVAFIKKVYERTQILPLFTVHDSINYYVDKNADVETLTVNLERASREVRMPYRIEEY